MDRDAAVDLLDRLHKVQNEFYADGSGAALKRLLGRQGVPVREDVRAPLRTLTFEERDELDAWHASLSE